MRDGDFSPECPHLEFSRPLRSLWWQTQAASPLAARCSAGYCGKPIRASIQAAHSWYMKVGVALG